MKLVTYLHVSRCLEPCGGVGRHANNLVRRLAGEKGVEQTLLCSTQYVGADGLMPGNFPLSDLPRATIPMNELPFERVIRLAGMPALDRFGPKADWYYSPMETPLPVRRGVASACTVHDIAAFETNLPWSDTPGHHRIRRTWGFWMPKVLRHVDRILTVSQYSKERMVTLLGADPDRIHVVGNGVDRVFFDRGAALAGQAEKRDEIVVLGGLRYKKGADHVLEVAAELARRGSPLRIVVIGQNEQAYVDRAGAHPNVEIYYMLPDAEVVERMAHARAVMLLSLYEGFGIPPLEGMALGTPAVVSDIASLPEVVGDAGLVVDPASTGEIVDRLEVLRTDSALYADLVAKGREHVKAYSWEACFARLLEVLR
ncbi:glycosyltransferase family 4 protein [Sagittula stellata]|uniref:glycosyltransferase family 4 protein n=1 Tax=Sagittula stellata TaxID=52603 RepID=UPI00321AB88A